MRTDRLYMGCEINPSDQGEDVQIQTQRAHSKFERRTTYTEART